jgi:hypothetical protein
MNAQSVESMHSVFVAVSLEAVASRMPATVDVQGSVLSLAAADAPGGRLRYDGSWVDEGPTEGIRLEVTRVSPTASQLEVAPVGQPAHLPRRARRRPHDGAGPVAEVASAVTAQLEGRRPPQPRPRQPRHPRRRLLIAAPVAAAVVTLSVVAASALLAPSPVTLDTATARYREAVAAAATQTPAAQAAAPQQTRARSRAANDADPVEPARPRRGADEPAAPERPAADRPAAAPAADAPAGPSQRAEQRSTDDRRSAIRETQVVPDPGVYRYTTKGWEEVDVPRGHRRFPSETTQTIVHTDCGYRMRWDPMEERWDETALCPRQGTLQPAEIRTFRSFFGRAVEQHFVCRPSKAGERGAEWAVACKSEDTTMTTVARPLGLRTMRVDGDAVEVSGLQISSTLKGANTGERSSVLWHARDGGVLVHAEVSGQLKVDGPFGKVDYREQYTLHLASLTPHR